MTQEKGLPIIKSKTLELIAKIIGDMDSATPIINLLTNCGVDNKLIEYPQTKWRMVNAVLQALAISENPKDFRTLYKIIEEACHPLAHEGNEEKAKEITNKFNSLLKYDDIYLEDGKLFRKSDYNDDEWIRSDGEIIEPECYIIVPQAVAELHVFWNELVKITKFYLSNPNGQSDEINEIYFEIIKRIEDVLEKKQCGRLHLIYKRPFQNLIGCEYEIRKIDKKTDDVLINLFAFFGEITATNLPEKKLVEDVKKESKSLLDKIETYIKTHSPIIEAIKDKTTELQPLPIRIISGKMEIEGLEKGLDAIAKTNKKSRSKFPHRLSAGTIWENFIIKFLDNENVFIQVKQFEHNTNYKEMGFIGKGINPRPSEAWTFLKVLATVNGELSFKDPKKKDKYKKQKELLAKSLQDYFSLDYDPFYPYRSSSEKNGNSYKIKITLIPPPESNEGKAINKDEDTLGIKEYLDEQNPQVYEDK